MSGTSTITHDGKGLFIGLPQDLEVMRYHSLIVEKIDLPNDLEITATSEDGEIMGLRHKKYPLEGVQFHPESFATEGGKIMMSNFLFSTLVIPSGERNLFKTKQIATSLHSSQ